MRLFILTALTMMAFAANSVLNRLAVESEAIDPSSFVLVRVFSGAVVLGLLVFIRSGVLPRIRRSHLFGGVSLSVYMLGFSMAYLSLNAGLGALILFGTVQIAMFSWTALRIDMPGSRAWIGVVVAFAGLMLALWPGEESGSYQLGGAALMVLSGLGWAAYSFLGRGAADPLSETAGNFFVAVPMLTGLFFVSDLQASAGGIALAIVSGALTSGLGYALWYSVLPKIRAETAAVVQLSVPLIAIAGGTVFLGEQVHLDLLIAAALVVGGIALTVTQGRR